jgi:chromosome segregation ATPase
VRAFTSTYASDAESCEDITFDELAETYKALCARSTEVCKTVENQKKIISQLETEKKDLLSTVDDLKEKVALLTSELNNVNKSVKMLNTGTTMLDEILQGGQRVGDMKGIGSDFTEKACFPSEEAGNPHVGTNVTTSEEASDVETEVTTSQGTS